MLDRAGFPDLTEEALATVPLERAETIPSAWYTEPRFHDLERECVFARTWQAVGQVGQVRSAGDYVLADVAGDPIIVVRGKDGQLRAFYNVCRHRGGPLATADGHADVLQCHYHGWTYLLDGSLRGVPSFDRVELFDRKDFGLVPVHVETWEGLVFVNLAERPLPLGTYLAGIAERIAPVTFGAKQFARRVDYDVQCNWKVYVDNYLEGYHVPLVHPELCSLYDYRSYVTAIHRWDVLQHSPFNDQANPYNASGGEAFYYWIFPNCMLNIVPGRLQSNLVVPLAPNRTRVVFQYYYDDRSAPAALDQVERDIAFSDQVQREDMEICERVQRGLESRAYDRGRFSVKFEEGVHHFQRLLKEAYRDWMHGR